MDPNRPNIYGLSLQDLAGWLHQKSIRSANGQKIFQKLYKNRSVQIHKKAFDDLNTDSPLLIRDFFISRYDQTTKFIFALKRSPENVFEAVLIPEKDRLTLCISSQVGCKRRCTFCQTGRMGLKTNLQTEEIVSQVVLANEWIKKNPTWLEKDSFRSVQNVVFMGMGEPLDNYDHVLKAISIMTSPFGLNLAPRKITVSTVGHIPRLRKLIVEQPQVSFAISLHAPEQRLRQQLMPIAKDYPLDEVLHFMHEYCATYPKRSIFLQYLLLGHINDAPHHATKLVEILKDSRVKINLIPWNPIDQSSFEASDPQRIKEFRKILQKAKIPNFVRYSKGQDIEGACGQLADRLSASV